MELRKITHSNLQNIIKLAYTKKNEKGRKIPLIIYGTFGIGKSEGVFDGGLYIADKIEKRNHVSWNDLDEDEKNIVEKNLKDYFIQFDVRLSECDITDTKGLPFPTEHNGQKAVVWIPPNWAKILQHKDSRGILLFDELNLAEPSVISSIYKIIYDRVINESKINDEWLIIGCGNNDDDRAFTHELATPVRDRGCEMELIPPTLDEWLSWAMKHDIDVYIVGFLSWKPSYLHNVDFNSGQKPTTPRGWARLNTMIKNSDDEEIELIAGTSIGLGIATEYLAYRKLNNKVKIEDVIKKPEIIKSWDSNRLDLKYFLICGLAEKYRDDKIDISKVFEVGQVLDDIGNTDFVSMFLRLCYSYNTKKFERDFKTKELNHKLRVKLQKLMLNW